MRRIVAILTAAFLAGSMPGPAGTMAAADAAGSGGGAEPPSANAGTGAVARPARVVSTNLCTDLLALLLAEPGQLVSVSHVVHDPVASPLHQMAGAIPENHGAAEEIHLLAPDLVLAGEWDDPVPLAMLESLGIRVERFPIERDFDDARANIRRVAALLGVPERGEAAVAELDAGLADEKAPPWHERPVAVVLGAGSWTSGAGTLTDAVLAAAGFRNLAAERGISGMGRLSLEELLLAQPDLIIVGDTYGTPALAEERLRHPAARGLGRTRRVAMPDNLWTCGTPLLAEAVAMLRAEARALATERANLAGRGGR